MKIKLTQKETAIVPIFANIQEDQFFLNEEGYLCQKVNEEGFTYIADAEGNPNAAGHCSESSHAVVTPLAHVTKISWS